MYVSCLTPQWLMLTEQLKKSLRKDHKGVYAAKDVCRSWCTNKFAEYNRIETGKTFFFCVMQVTTDDKLKKRQERFGAVTFSGATAAGVKSTNLAEEVCVLYLSPFGVNLSTLKRDKRALVSLFFVGGGGVCVPWKINWSVMAEYLRIEQLDIASLSTTLQQKYWESHSFRRQNGNVQRDLDWTSDPNKVCPRHF